MNRLLLLIVKKYYYYTTSFVQRYFSRATTGYQNLKKQKIKKSEILFITYHNDIHVRCPTFIKQYINESFKDVYIYAFFFFTFVYIDKNVGQEKKNQI